ncbi:MAG: TspO/MBR family protein [Beijerinckiaceae bacterium]
MQIISKELIPAFSTRSLVFLAIAVFIVVAAAISGSSATGPNIATWYSTIKKPWFNPPNWIFPVVWPILYSLMALGFWRVLRQVDGGRDRKTAIFAFLIMIVFNAAWSFAFFGAQSPLAGLVVIAGLWLSIVYMVLSFRKVDALSAWLQLPYLGWVSFASLLNIAIWRLN